MSRCFPYLPPGYIVKRDNSDALIESIKLQRATTEKAKSEEKAKADRKAERKKEKKREKKEKKHHDKKRKRTDEKEHKSDKESANLKGKTLQNGGDEEQRSGVTEEHEQPASLQRPCYSSDSTENSNKRRRPTLPEYGISSHGSTIKIRLSSLKRKESDPVLSKDKPLPLTTNTGSAPKLDSALLVQKQPSITIRKPLAAVKPDSALKQVSTAPLVEKPKHPLASVKPDSALKQVSTAALVEKPKHPLASVKPASQVSTAPLVEKPKHPLASVKPGSALKQVSTAPLVEKPKHPLASVKPGSALKQVSTAPIVEKQKHPLASVRTIDSRTDKEQGCSTSGVGVSRDCAPLFDDKAWLASSSVPRVSKEVKKAASLYKELFENWVAPSLQNDQMDVDDQDWLFQSKPQKHERSKVESAGADVCSRSSMLWPRAQFLPDVDVFALPFTVPF